MFSSVFVFLTILCAPTLLHILAASEGFYRAAVLEYAPSHNPSLDKKTNILNNVAAYVSYMKQAADQVADIIVFPEVGLIGLGNRAYYVELPTPEDKVVPCLNNTALDIVLIQLSCAARNYSLYTVVNIPEKYYNTTQSRTRFYSTNIVFDTNGAIIARYRKFNVYGPDDSSETPLEHTTFTTKFGVTFGMFICFDLVFKEPAVTVAREQNITHFVFSTAWNGELPFLTAVQAHWMWAYGLDVILLASGYSKPAGYGATGSGVYIGRKGALTYYMTETQGCRLLVADVPKKLSLLKINDVNSYGTDNNEIQKTEEETLPSFVYNQNSGLQETENNIKLSKNKSRLFLLRDHLDVYKTEAILSTDNIQQASIVNRVNNSYATILTTLKRTICYRSLCCRFSINMTTSYTKDYTETTRGDDFMKYHYHLAIFDGVRTYSGYSTGGVQVCSIIPCVNETLASCGLRSDDESAKPGKFIYDNNLIQTSTVFESIEITSEFVYNNTLVSPNILVTGADDNYGALVPSNMFIYNFKLAPNSSAVAFLKMTKSISNLVSFAIYARQFNRDGEKEDTVVTDTSPIQDSSGASSVSGYYYICIFLIYYLLSIN